MPVQSQPAHRRSGRYREVTSRDDFSRIIARASTAGFSHHADLVRQARSGRLNLVQIDRVGISPMRAVLGALAAWGVPLRGRS